MGKSLEKENEISQQIKTLHAEQIALTDGTWSIEINMTALVVICV